MLEFMYRTCAIGFYEGALETGSEFVPQNSPNLTEHRFSLEGNLKIVVKTVFDTNVSFCCHIKPLKRPINFAPFCFLSRVKLCSLPVLQ